MVNKKTAVIGDPIDHSLSPKIHNHWIESEKIDVGTYQKINVKTIQRNWRPSCGDEQSRNLIFSQDLHQLHEKALQNLERN